MDMCINIDKYIIYTFFGIIVLVLIVGAWADKRR